MGQVYLHLLRIGDLAFRRALLKRLHFLWVEYLSSSEQLHLREQQYI